LGDNVKIYPNCFIGDNVVIGDNALLFAGAKIYSETIIGNNCTIHSGAIIGSDGFGFAPNPDGTYTKIPQIGNVIIEDNVDIGSCTTIDRATMGSTIIRKGVKLDNQIQIAHNVEIEITQLLQLKLELQVQQKLVKRLDWWASWNFRTFNHRE
jgi:UDP-3-O-[3-hydroxymyristoyl] glucosamine N-acyltransferase